MKSIGTHQSPYLFQTLPKHGRIAGSRRIASGRIAEVRFPHLDVPVLLKEFHLPRRKREGAKDLAVESVSILFSHAFEKPEPFLQGFCWSSRKIRIPGKNGEVTLGKRKCLDTKKVPVKKGIHQPSFWGKNPFLRVFVRCVRVLGLKPQTKVISMGVFEETHFTLLLKRSQRYTTLMNRIQAKCHLVERCCRHETSLLPCLKACLGACLPNITTLPTCLTWYM